MREGKLWLRMETIKYAIDDTLVVFMLFFVIAIWLHSHLQVAMLESKNGYALVAARCLEDKCRQNLAR